MNYVFSLIGYPVKGLFSISPVTPITEGIGSQLLGTLGGILPVDTLMGLPLVTLYASAFVIVLAGNFLVSQFKLPTMKSRTGRLASIILWGAVPVYLLLVGFQMIAFLTLVGLFVYTFIAAFVAGWISDRVKITL